MMSKVTNIKWWRKLCNDIINSFECDSEGETNFDSNQDIDDHKNGAQGSSKNRSNSRGWDENVSD